MISARLSLSQALETAAVQCGDRRLREVLVEVRKDVHRGKSLSVSLERHGEVFDGLYVQLVRVGEAAGVLHEMLLRLATYLEKSTTLRRKVRLAMVYPGVVLAVALAAVVFLLTVIVPIFAEMFADFGAELPAPTLIVLHVSNALTSHFLALTVMAAVAVSALKYLKRTPKGRHVWESLLISLPFIGSLVRKSLVARFCRTLATLLGGGVPLADALGILVQASSHLRIEESVRAMLKGISRGGRLAQGLDKAGIFPPMVVQMIAVGEETARLDEMLFHVAAHYEEEVDVAVESLTSVIEPVLIVLLGVILGSILVAMYLPMFDLVNVVR